MNSTLCTICMRGGSQGVKNKNYRLINGKPLMYYTIKQAVKSKLFENIVVSTDSKKILRYAKSYGAEGWFLRPKKLASNLSPKIPVIKHVLRESEIYYKKKYDYIVDLDVTSPLRKIDDITKAFKFFLKKNADILITGARSKKNPYFNVVEKKNGKIKKVLGSEKKISRRQDAPITYDMNASIYIWKRNILLNSKSLYESKTVLYEMPESRSIDLDSNFDLKLLKLLI